MRRKKCQLVNKQKHTQLFIGKDQKCQIGFIGDVMSVRNWSPVDILH